MHYLVVSLKMNGLKKRNHSFSAAPLQSLYIFAFIHRMTDVFFLKQ